jgi:hypothetical protein
MPAALWRAVVTLVPAGPGADPLHQAADPHAIRQVDAQEQVRLRTGERVNWLRAVDKFSEAVLWTADAPLGGWLQIPPPAYQADRRDTAAEVQRRLEAMHASSGTPARTWTGSAGPAYLLLDVTGSVGRFEPRVPPGVVRANGGLPGSPAAAARSVPVTAKPGTPSLALGSTAKWRHRAEGSGQSGRSQSPAVRGAEAVRPGPAPGKCPGGRQAAAQSTSRLGRQRSLCRPAKDSSRAARSPTTKPPPGAAGRLRARSRRARSGVPPAASRSVSSSSAARPLHVHPIPAAGALGRGRPIKEESAGRTGPDPLRYPGRPHDAPFGPPADDRLRLVLRF